MKNKLRTITESINEASGALTKALEQDFSQSGFKFALKYYKRDDAGEYATELQGKYPLTGLSISNGSISASNTVKALTTKLVKRAGGQKAKAKLKSIGLSPNYVELAKVEDINMIVDALGKHGKVEQSKDKSGGNDIVKVSVSDLDLETLTAVLNDIESSL